MNTDTKSTFTFTIRDIIEIAIFVSIAVILDTFVKIPVTATGGSVNIATLPLFFIALDKHWFKGFIASGIIFGLITCLLDGYGFVTYPLDYLFGFGSVCILGFFSSLIKLEDGKAKFKSYLFLSLGVTLAFGVVIYEVDIVGSMVYQLTYIIPSYIAVLLLINLLLEPFLKFSKKRSV